MEPILIGIALILLGLAPVCITTRRTVNANAVKLKEIAATLHANAVKLKEIAATLHAEQILHWPPQVPSLSDVYLQHEYVVRERCEAHVDLTDGLGSLDAREYSVTLSQGETLVFTGDAVPDVPRVGGWLLHMRRKTADDAESGFWVSSKHIKPGDEIDAP